MTNFANRTIWTGDNLDIMRGLNSASVDLIYLDPPFNSNSDYNTSPGDAPSSAVFKYAWTPSDIDVGWIGLIADEDPPIYQVLQTAGLTHGNSMRSYLCMMAVRLMEMRRLLKATGSIYLHCDASVSHYLKLLMDSIFGVQNFRNEITWRPKVSRGFAFRGYPQNSSFLLFYTLSDVFTWNRPVLPHDTAYVEKVYRYIEPGTERRYRLGPLTRPDTGRPDLTYEWNGHTRAWRWTKDRMQEAHDEGLIHYSSVGLASQKRYFDDMEGPPVDSVWEDIRPTQSHFREQISFPAQQPLALLDRVIKASSNEGDLVLDPFCGSGTSCVASENLKRRWAAIDLSSQSVEILDFRLQQSMGESYHTAVITSRTDIPHRTDIQTPRPFLQYKHVLFGRQEGRCGACGLPFGFEGLFLDHVRPVDIGGTHRLENLQLLCASCKQIKANKSNDFDVLRQSEFDSESDL